MTWGLGRLRVVAGLEMRTDENHTQGVGILGYAEVLGGRGTLGAELRYQGWVEKWLAVHGGLMGNIAPESLFGGVVGAKLVLPMGDRFGLFVEPEFAAFPLGTDRPDNSVLMWFLLTGGVRASF